MFRGTRPKAQPRTLRSIAEDKGTAPARFDDRVPYESTAGAPSALTGAQDRYRDEAGTEPRETKRMPNAATPRPTTGVRRGR